jgi:hypothetical protein
VELQVLNAVEHALVVPGHDPCRTNSHCPMGKSWAPDIQTCR